MSLHFRVATGVGPGIVGLSTQRTDASMPRKSNQHSTAELTPEAVPVHLSIREVAKQTGLSESVLRVWEHRYRWPQPGRRSNGYRFYPITLIPVLQAVREEIERGKTIGDLLRDPVWTEIMESGRMPVETQISEKPRPDWSSIPQPQSEAARTLRVKLEAALERGDTGMVAWVEAQAGRLHPREREVAVTAVLELWRTRRDLDTER